jgi:hypothetical protein
MAVNAGTADRLCHNGLLQEAALVVCLCCVWLRIAGYLRVPGCIVSAGSSAGGAHSALLFSVVPEEQEELHGVIKRLRSN